MPKFKPTDKVLDLKTYANDTRMVSFKVVSGNTSDDPSQVIEIPIAIAYRLYHLGRAYDFQVVKHTHPDSRNRIDFVFLPSLIGELRKIYDIVNDPVTRHYLDQLIPALEAKRQDTKSALLIAAD